MSHARGTSARIRSTARRDATCTDTTSFNTVFFSSVIPDSEADSDETSDEPGLPVNGSCSPLSAHQNKSVRSCARRCDSYDVLECENSEIPPRVKRCATATAIDTDILQHIPITSPRLKRLREQLLRKRWRHIQDDLEDIVDMNLNCPAMIPADQCWRPRIPSALDVKVYCIDLPSEVRDDIVFEQAGREVTTTLGNVLRHIDRPCETPSIAHNVPMSDFDFDLDARVVSRYSKIDLPIPDVDDEYSMNITPKNVIVDVHIDQGTNGLSICVGRPEDPTNHCARKIWLFWPPTEHNMQRFEAMKRKRRKAHTILEQDPDLEHGIIADPKTDYGIFLPSGWLHATITIEGGFLVGKTFNSPATVLRSSQVLAMDCRLGGGMQPGLYEQTLRCAIDADEPAYLKDAVRGWLLHLEPTICKATRTFRRHEACQGEWRVIQQLWHRACRSQAAYFRGLALRACMAVDCKWVGSPSRFRRHFEAVHLEQCFALSFDEDASRQCRKVRVEARPAKRRKTK